MAKLPYGGFESSPPDYPGVWAKLNTVAEYLEDGEALPPHLAQWLTAAIRNCEKDPNALLVQLGLMKVRGRPASQPEGWLEYGSRVCELEDEGLPPEQALSRVLTELGDPVSRSTLQSWRDTYRKAMEEIRNIE